MVVSSWLVPDQAKLGVLLRLPLLHIMDSILLSSDNTSMLTLNVVGPVGDVSNESSLEAMYEGVSGKAPSVLLLVPHILRWTALFIVYLASAFTLTLNTHQLIVVYVYTTLTAALPFSLFAHHTLLTTEDNSVGLLGHQWLQSLDIVDTKASLFVRVLTDVYIQIFLAFLLSCLFSAHSSSHSDGRSNALTLVLVLLLNVPIVAHVYAPHLFYPLTMLCLVPPLLMTLRTLVTVLRSGWQCVIHIVHLKRQFLRHFGLYAFLEQEWRKMGVPTLLRTFWMTRLFLLAILNANVFLSTPQESTKEWLYYLLDISRFLLTRGSETLLAILGLTSVISGGCHYVGVMVQRVLQSDDEEYLASASAVLFFVLSLQTGLTTLQPEKRFTRLCKNLCLLLTALFHFVHNMVNPVLLSMSAGGKFGRRVAEKHARALTLCLILVLAPSALTSVLWKHFDISTWLLAVTVFCVEVVVKVAVTLTIYLLYLYDHKCQKGTWETLDDAVYYLKAVGNSIEFCFAVFLFFNGAFILFFESGGTIRALTMIIHAYCNIWCEAKSGWATFMKRRTAASKINRLPKATSLELEMHNDVCAICYQEMESAKKTLCGHFFHSVCLRKWLYMQDTCPMCHADLNPEEQKEKEQHARHPRQGQERELPNVLRYGLRRRQRRHHDEDDDVIEEDALDTQSSSDESSENDDGDDSIVAAAHQHPDLLEDDEDEDDDMLMSTLNSTSPS